MKSPSIATDRSLLSLRLLLFGVLGLAAALPGQGTAADYERESKLWDATRGKLRRFPGRIRWVEGGDGVWWKERGDSGAFIHVDRKGRRRSAATAEALGLPVKTSDRLVPRTTWSSSPRGRDRTTITFVNELDRTVRLFWADRSGRPRVYGIVKPGQRREMSTYVGHVWLTDFSANDLTGIFVAERDPGVAHIDAKSRELALRAVPERDRSRVRPRSKAGYRVRLTDHDLVGISPGGERFALTTDGTAEDAYQRPRYWSPDGKRALGFKVAPTKARRVPLIESSPKDAVQPELHWMNYRKPGDALDRRRPYLLDLEGRRSIPLDPEAFEAALKIDRIHWAEDGSRVFCRYVRRGHQVTALLAIDAKTGMISDVVRETTPTFLDTTHKTWVHWLKGSKQVLWMSERDGWNHVYRIDAATGEVVNQVTRGPWIVRQVEHFDAAKGQLWFTAMGLHGDQDPYHRHLARVDLDGSDLVALTEGDGTHEWDFSPDGALLLVRWSRVDHPEVTELRRSSDGALIAELGRDDAGALADAGFAPPQRFVAKGRDGRTDIWGFILRPSNFESGRKYPVIEHVYAGPQGHHVPKAFGLHYANRRIAELGFIVVRIDGMGTNWRSKAFHDVCWQNLKDGGFPDRIAWLRAAARAHPELDLSRVGIYGGSAGGQNALAALLHHGDFYHAAAADCGCHDNRMDKRWWNEAWMGEMGPHYADNSNVTHAGKLEGKLLLTVGELDRNVDPASTLQVVDALIKADKDFEFVIVPGAGHGIGESSYLFRRRQDFFVRALWGAEPRR